MLELFPSRTIFLSIFGYSIHWYGVMYALAFWIAYALLPKLGELRGIKISRDQWTMLIAYAGIGVLIGGRVGYALFYQPIYFLHQPLQIFSIWNGGMSSHGGFIGVAVAVWLWGKKYKVPFLSLLDIATVPSGIGLALGRLGNFINQEIYTGYGAFIDIFLMLVIAGVCYALVRGRFPLHLDRGRAREGVSHTDKSAPIPSFPLIRGKGALDGSVIAVFLILYSISRFFLEYIRVHEWSYVFEFTRGQFYTIPLFLLGVVLFSYANKRRISAKV